MDTRDVSDDPEVRARIAAAQERLAKIHRNGQ